MHESHHEMRLARINPSGEEEWYCPSCGRRILMRWPPAHAKIILEPGDAWARHTGRKLCAQDETAPDADRLQPWIEALDEINFDALWGEAA